MSSVLWFEIGRCGAIAAFLGIGWLTRQKWFPHRHDGYVSVSGYVHTCAVCGKLPAGAVRAGAYGTNPESPEARRYEAFKTTKENQ